MKHIVTAEFVDGKRRLKYTAMLYSAYDGPDDGATHNCTVMSATCQGRKISVDEELEGCILESAIEEFAKADFDETKPIPPVYKAGCVMIESSHLVTKRHKKKRLKAALRKPTTNYEWSELEKKGSKMESALDQYTIRVIEAVHQMVDEYDEEEGDEPLPIGGCMETPGGDVGFLAITGIIPGQEVTVDLDVMDCYVDIDIPDEFNLYERISFQPTMDTQKDADKLVKAICKYQQEHAIKSGDHELQEVISELRRKSNGENNQQPIQDAIGECAQYADKYNMRIITSLEYFAVKAWIPPVFANKIGWSWTGEDATMLERLTNPMGA